MTVLRVVAYAPNGASQGLLPTPDDVQVGYPLNDVGALTLNYAPEAPRVSLLGQPVELAVETSYDLGQTWTEPPSSRFLYLRDGRDPIKTGDAFSVEAAGYLIRLQKALVGLTGLNGDGVREFVTQKPGFILATLWEEAVARGALAGMTRTWTNTADTAGTAWPENIGQITYEPGKDLLSVLSELADAGYIDFRTTGRSVEVYVQESTAGMAADRTLGASPVILQAGRDLIEAPFRRTWEGLADTVLLRGDEGSSLERTNLAAIKPWGRQETYATASGVKDTGTLTVIADAVLALSERERTEHTFGLDFTRAPHLPFRDYSPGEWVFARTANDAPPVRMRVRQITLTRDTTGQASGNVVLNDRFLESDVLTLRRIARLTGNATQAGTGGTPTSGGAGNDILAPAQVLGLVGSSDGYLRPDGTTQSQITLDWNDVTTNADGTGNAGVTHYEVWGRLGTVGPFSKVAETTSSQWNNSPYDPGRTWNFQVRAVDQVFNRGAFSATVSVNTATDATPPIETSAPTAETRLGTMRVNWNGLSSVGGAMDPDLAAVRVHVSTTSNFTPTDATQVGTLPKGGGAVSVGQLVYGTIYYARLVPVDTSGNAGVASVQASATVQPLVDVSNFPDSAMDVLYARTGHFIDLTAANFSANIITADYIDFGTLTGEIVTGFTIQTHAGAFDGVRLNPQGIYAYNTAGLDNETSLTFRVLAADGSVYIKGATVVDSDFQVGTTGGERVVIRKDGAGGIIEFYSGVSGESVPGVLDPGIIAGTPAVTLRPGQTAPGGGFNVVPSLVMQTGNLTSRMDLTATAIVVSSSIGVVGESWNNLVIASPYTAVAGQTPQYRLFADGTVHLRGAVNRNTATTGSTVATLPATGLKYRPIGASHFGIVRTNANGNYAVVGVGETGTITMSWPSTFTPVAFGLETVFSGRN